MEEIRLYEARTRMLSKVTLADEVTIRVGVSAQRVTVTVEPVTWEWDAATGDHEATLVGAQAGEPTAGG